MQYWNHNTAYHPLIVDAARRHHGDVLDVGCGEGLLVERVAPYSRLVVGVEIDGLAATRAQDRLRSLSNTRIEVGDFSDLILNANSFDLITFVATLHHLDLETSLSRAKSLLRIDGELIVIGLATNTSVADYAWSAVMLPFVRILGRVHGETTDVGVTMKDPDLSLHEIRKVADRVLTGYRVRRGLYYRYILTWTKTA